MSTNLYERVMTALRRSSAGSYWIEVARASPGLDIFLAGGSVRDLLLGKESEPKDLDFFLGGSGFEEVLARLAGRGSVASGPFGSPRWFPSGLDNFHVDVIPVAQFSNGLWCCEDIVDVLNQFDFTANAVAIHLRTGEVFDPQNGRRDIERRILRAVRFDYPEEPIRADCRLTRPTVVWFRLLHYAAHLAFEIEPVTASWIVERRDYRKWLPEFTAEFFPPDRKAWNWLDTRLSP